MIFRSKIDELDTKEIVNSQYIDWELYRGATILLTGATGLIGSQIIKSLIYTNETLNTNIKILALARNKKKCIKIFGKNRIKNLIYIYQDILSPVRYGKNVDYIIHTANGTSSKGFTETPVETIDTIINGTKNILDFGIKKKVKGVIYLSSMEVYGTCSLETEKPLKENEYNYIDILNVRSSYSEGKRLAETLCHSYAKEYNLPVKIARLVQTIGAGVDYNDNRVFAEFARAVIEEKDIILHSEGKTTRNYCYITDAVTALFKILETGENAECYNVANSDKSYSILEMAELLIKKYSTSKLKYEIDDAEYCWYLKPTKNIVDTTKLKSLGWSAKIELPEMLDRLIEDMRSRGGT